MEAPLPQKKQKPGKPRGIRRDRDCQTCRQRGVKCDLNRPSCHPCKRDGLACGGYPQRVVWTQESQSGKPISGKPRPTIRSQQPSAASKEPPPTCEVPAAATSADLTTDKLERGKNSSITRLAVICSRLLSHSDEEPGHASTDQLVYNIYAFIQARRQEHPGTSWQPDQDTEPVESLQRRLVAITGLNDALRTANPVALLGIATFAVFDVCDGEYGEWQRHLYGAKSVLDHHYPTWDSLSTAFHTLPGLDEVLSWLVWFDVMGAVVKGKIGLVLDKWHRRIMQPSFFNITGCPEDVFDLLHTIASGEAANDALASTFLAMEQLSKISQNDTDHSRAANMYRFASVIASIMTIGVESVPIRAHREIIRSCVDKICDVIELTPPTSLHYTHISMATYLAGINATQETQCRILRYYWMSCKLGGRPQYPGGLSYCENIWRAKGLTK